MFWKTQPSNIVPKFVDHRFTSVCLCSLYMGCHIYSGKSGNRDKLQNSKTVGVQLERKRKSRGRGGICEIRLVGKFFVSRNYFGDYFNTVGRELVTVTRSCEKVLFCFNMSMKIICQEKLAPAWEVYSKTCNSNTSTVYSHLYLPKIMPDKSRHKTLQMLQYKYRTASDMTMNSFKYWHHSLHGTDKIS